MSEPGEEAKALWESLKRLPDGDYDALNTDKRVALVLSTIQRALDEAADEEREAGDTARADCAEMLTLLYRLNRRGVLTDKETDYMCRHWSLYKSPLR